MSLTKCISRAGKAIDKKDADVIQEAYGKYLDNGLEESEAAELALKDLEKSIDAELEDIAGQVEKAGGKVARPDQESNPMMFIRDDELVDANDFIKEIDDDISAIDDVITCLYGGAS